MDETKLKPKDLGCPCQEFFARDLGLVVTLPVRPVINFVCASTGEQSRCIHDHYKPRKISIKEPIGRPNGFYDITFYFSWLIVV